MIEVCKYRLPCGRCDKFDKYCDLTVEQMDFIAKNKEENCEHDWLLAMRKVEDATQYNYVVCSKCGAQKIYMQQFNHNDIYDKETKVYITELKRWKL